MKLKQSDYKLIGICVVLVIISLVIFSLKNEKEDNKDTNDYSKYKLVTDYSRFFTVNSCIYKYIVFLETEDFDNLFKVLDKDYVENNNLNSNNIYNYISKLEGNNSFVSKKMYSEEISSDYIRYYVYGYLYLDDLDSPKKSGENYYIVDLDLKNELFSITPSNEQSFREVQNG